jgi:hypothetical protein
VSAGGPRATTGDLVLYGVHYAIVTQNKYRGRALIRAIFLIPYVLPSFVVATVWRTMLQPDGIINSLLNKVGIGDQLWLSGPTAEERAQYAHRVRQRRVAEAFDEGEARISEGVRMGVRAGRETQLAAEGALNVLYRWSRRTFADLVRAGREWEEETSLPNRRRRVSLDDEDS